MIYISSATEDDMTGILEIERESISPPWTHGALLGEIFRDDSFFAVARRHGLHSAETDSTIGFIILRRAADEGELFQIAVDKASRRRGVAGMLMDAALGYASAKALLTLYLEVRKSNEAAINLYKKCGFHPMRQRKNYYDSPVEDAVVMVWKA